MAVLDSALQEAWSPHDYGKLIDTVIAAKSVAFHVATVVQTGNESIRFPMITADPAVGWYAENTQISLTDPTTNELVITPKKTAGLTQISNEAYEDTNPAIAEQVGTSLARSIAKKIDAAFFANTTTNAPNGVLSLSGIQTVDPGATYTNLDAFHEAKSHALTNGATLTHFVLAQDVALALSQAKVGTGYNTSLLDTNGVVDGLTIAGVPVIVSVDVADGNVWGFDASQVYTVQRTGTTVVPDKSAAFAYDAVQIRATARVSWGFANPAGVVNIVHSA
ncbi:phage major capsid protein [Mycobacterium arosiense]|uniref:Capsid protein n=1 Tax=Mycobacterium arosiense ATCC BAA-1401 = DSM 45069 TaxID=1265311 RepID=A0A1W9ZQG6_MYCAI|nr:phage major capsid protein [Mycobacterium arosiense]ORA20040.1 capsid protein [Mycobacterium arosiense ATCC BAA-1401 = DSM 45069]